MCGLQLNFLVSAQGREFWELKSTLRKVVKNTDVITHLILQVLNNDEHTFEGKLVSEFFLKSKRDSEKTQSPFTMLFKEHF